MMMKKLFSHDKRLGLSRTEEAPQKMLNNAVKNSYQIYLMVLHLAMLNSPIILPATKVKREEIKIAFSGFVPFNI